MRRDRPRVLCVTPCGDGGRGGIDRLYHYVRGFAGDALSDQAEVRFFAARGRAPGALWILAFPWRLVLFTLCMATWRPDVVHLNHSMGGSVFRKYALLRVARLFGARVMLHFHGQFTQGDIAAGSPVIRCLVRLARSADCIVALGQAYREAFVQGVGVPADRVAVLANGIPDFAPDLDLPKPDGTALRLLFAGEVGERKGADLLMEALARLAGQPDWTCVVAGNGELAPYRARAEAAGIAERVRFTGWVNSAEMHHLMRDCDVVLLPSRAETMPLTLIEGACAGAALIATPVGEVRDVVIPGENGLLVEPDPEEIAVAIRFLCAHPDERARMQIASRRLYENRFELTAFVTRLGALYRAVAAGAVPAQALSTSANA